MDTIPSMSVPLDRLCADMKRGMGDFRLDLNPLVSPSRVMRDQRNGRVHARRPLQPSSTFW